MSFHLEYYAQSVDDAEQVLTQNATVPQSVREFVRAALKTGSGPVYVKTFGHLSSQNDYPISNATIEVKPIIFVEPKA